MRCKRTSNVIRALIVRWPSLWAALFATVVNHDSALEVDVCDLERNPSQDKSSVAHHPQKGKSKDLRGWQNYTFECSLRHRVTAMLITARSLTLGLRVMSYELERLYESKINGGSSGAEK